MLADTLRTDRARHALTPDSPATATLRVTCWARKDLVGHRVALANQLRANLLTALPGALGLFSDLDSAISPKFLGRFDTQDKLDWLSPKRLDAWLRNAGYSGRIDPAVLHTRLTVAPRGLTGADGAAQAHATRVVLTVATSLPRSGTVRLLAEIGDCARFPTPESLACLAGVAPSARQSGRHRAVTFRWAADKQLRDAAGDSRRANPWAVRILARAWL